MKFRNITVMTIVAIIAVVPIIMGFTSSYAIGVKSESSPKTEVLQRVDIHGTNYQAGMGVVKYAPNQIKPSQVQTGPEMVYIVSGELIYIGLGKPAKTIKAGDSFQIPLGEAHYSKGGKNGAIVIATWILEKNRPFVKLINTH